jgi:hypothetical protein
VQLPGLASQPLARRCTNLGNFHGDEHVSEKTIAFALSSGIGQISITFASAFFVSHVLVSRAHRGKKSLKHSSRISRDQTSYEINTDHHTAASIRDATAIRASTTPYSSCALRP